MTLTGTGRFSESAWWLCINPDGAPHLIGGTLAEILSQYVEYGLKFLAFDDEGLRRWQGRQQRKDINIPFPGRGHSPNFRINGLYWLYHTKCGIDFLPTQQVRLNTDENGVERGYLYQDLMMGECPQCQVSVFAYVGVNHVNEPVRYEAIGKKEHDEWMGRIETCSLVKPKPKLRPPGTNGPDDLGESKVERGTVCGTPYHNKAGTYLHQEMIPVR